MSASPREGSWRLDTSFAPSGFFVLRTPLLPFDDFVSWSADLEAPRRVTGRDGSEHDHALDEALRRDRALLRARLRDVLARPEVREALLLASPSISAFLARWTDAPEGRRGRKAENALVRYFSRMTGRSTPFGLFAGHSLGVVGQKTELELCPREAYRRSTRLDGAYVASLVDALVSDPALTGELACRPNSSLYRVAGQLRYVTYRVERGRRIHRLAAVDETPALRTVLDRAEEGADAGDLAASLAGGAITSGQALEFIRKLLARRILAPELEPPVTGPDGLAHLAAQLRAGGAASRPLADRLEDVRTSLEAIDVAGLGVPPKRYHAVADQLRDLPAEVDQGPLFQVDLRKPSPGLSLGPEVMAELTRGVEIFRKLGRPAADPLDAFRDAFRARFERREVPLVEALDEDLGVGFPQRDSSLDVAWGRREAILLDKVVEAARTGRREAVLVPGDVADLPAAELPDAFAVFGALAAPSAAAVSSGDFLFCLHGLAGASGAGLFTRFARADTELGAWVGSHLRREESLDPEAILAEVAHRPQGRWDNVLHRPLLREFEIDYLGPSGAPLAQRIAAADLLVSVEGERVVLRSSQLGRRVAPRVTSAYDVRQAASPLFRFLAGVQNQGDGGGLGWSWGPLASADFLPRLRIGRIVLHRATWRVSGDDLAGLRHERPASRFRKVAAWRVSRKLPRYILVGERDRLLPVDLDNAMTVDALLELVDRRGGATMSELFPAPAELCVRGPEGRFFSELVVPFVRQGPVKRARSATPLSPTVPAGFRRTLPPGAQWLYLKLYGGPAFADDVICNVVSPRCRELLADGVIDRWFFLRYRDPEAHVRVRLHGRRERLHDGALPAFQDLAAQLIDERRLWRVTLDTYEREVERYGGAHGMVVAERVFHLDSEAVAGALSADPRSGAPATDRWRAGVAGVDAFLTALGLPAIERRGVVERQRDAHARLQGLEGRLKGVLGQSFREERAGLEALLDPSATPPPGVRALQRGLASLAPLAEELWALEHAGRLTSSPASIAESLVHMHLNRLLRAPAGRDELRVYDHLAKLYVARAYRAG